MDGKLPRSLFKVLTESWQKVGGPDGLEGEAVKEEPCKAPDKGSIGEKGYKLSFSSMWFASFEDWRARGLHASRLTVLR